MKKKKNLTILLGLFLSFSVLALDPAVVTDSFKYQRQINQLNQEKILSAEQKIKVATYNLGLLNGLIAKVPLYEERSHLLKSALDQYLKEESPEALCFQELWYKNDFEAVSSVAKNNGYDVAVKNFDKEKAGARGLQILVKKSSLKILESTFDFYRETSSHSGHSGAEIKSWFEFLGGYERGLLNVEVQLSNGALAVVGTTHLTPLLSETQTRLKQVVALANILNEKEKKGADYLIVAADFNLSPLSANALPNEVKDWEKNGEVYLAFQHQSGLLDSFISVGHDNAEGFTQDRTKNSLTRNSGSTKDEPEQRIDYVWAGGMKPMAVMESKLIFTKPYGQGKSAIYLSDHFGVSSTLSY